MKCLKKSFTNASNIAFSVFAYNNNNVYWPGMWAGTSAEGVNAYGVTPISGKGKELDTYCVSKKSWPILYSKLLYKMAS